MGTPMTQTAIVTKSYASGAAKLGTPVCQITHPDNTQDHKILGAHQTAGGHPELKPGQAYHTHGSTVANPQPSDIEVEAIIGKKIYDPKPDPRSKEEIVLKANEANGKIEKLEAMILQQGNIIQAFMVGKNTDAQVAKPIENTIEPVTKTVTESAIKPVVETEPTLDCSMELLRAMAKPYSIKTARMSKETLIEAINYARG